MTVSRYHQETYFHKETELERGTKVIFLEKEKYVMPWKAYIYASKRWTYKYIWNQAIFIYH